MVARSKTGCVRRREPLNMPDGLRPLALLELHTYRIRVALRVGKCNRYRTEIGERLSLERKRLNQRKLAAKLHRLCALEPCGPAVSQWDDHLHRLSAVCRLELEHALGHLASSREAREVQFHSRRCWHGSQTDDLGRQPIYPNRTCSL